MKKVKPPKYPTFYMWEETEEGTIYIWYPSGKSERLEQNGEWIDAEASFDHGPFRNDVKICEIK